MNSSYNFPLCEICSLSSSNYLNDCGCFYCEYCYYITKNNSFEYIKCMNCQKEINFKNIINLSSNNIVNQIINKNNINFINNILQLNQF